MPSIRNRYAKSLEGLNAIGFVASALAYTGATTYAAFVASAATAANNGALAIFNHPANTLRSTALTPGDQFFIAQIVDGNIKKTPVYTFGTANGTTVKKTVYAAPVKQAISVGFNGTAGTSGIAAPSAGNVKNYVLSARDTSPSTQPFPVQEGRVKVTKTTATIYDIAAALVSDLQNLNDNQRNADINFVEAKILLVGTDAAIATVTATFTSGSKNVVFSGASTCAVGDIISVGNAGTSQVYKVVAVVGGNNDPILDRPFVGDTVTTGAGGVFKVTVPTEVGIVLSSIVEDTTFVVTLQEDLASATVTNTTAWKQGAGAPFQIAAMEEQTQVMDGLTTINAQWAADYGAPTKFAAADGSAVTYNTYYLSFINKTPSMAYVNEQTQAASYAILACPVSGNTPNATISTVLTGS